MIFTKAKKKVDPKQVSRAATTAAPTPTADPLALKGTDPLSKLADDMAGPSALKDNMMGTALDAGTAAGLMSGGGEEQLAPEVGGGGSDPLRWVMGTQAPSIAGMRDMAQEAITEALKLHKHAPKTKENKAFLNAARTLENEIGQFGALTSLAKMSGNWQWCGIHAAGQLLEALAAVSEMAQALIKDKESHLRSRAQEYTGKMRAGRQNFYSQSVPFYQHGAGWSR